MARRRRALVTAPDAKQARQPLYCAGCPHSTSTRVPTGSRAGAGIGCHYMAQWMDRNTHTVTHMGAEGANWIGHAPFTDERHIFVNLGDGTYFHSGVLAIRAAVAAGVNVTYKILANDAVAMTGGQPVEGALTVPDIFDQVVAEGVGTVRVVADDPSRHRGSDFPVAPRRELDAIQRELRQMPGCTVLIYDQTCATELRRRRKRGQALDPDVRVVINDAVCEGCGDCTRQSNCVAIAPLPTALGVKRTIDQSTCNKDLSCLAGFCPALVTLKGAKLKRNVAAPATLENLKRPVATAGRDARPRQHPHCWRGRHRRRHCFATARHGRTLGRQVGIHAGHDRAGAEGRRSAEPCPHFAQERTAPADSYRSAGCGSADRRGPADGRQPRCA